MCYISQKVVYFVYLILFRMIMYCIIIQLYSFVYCTYTYTFSKISFVLYQNLYQLYQNHKNCIMLIIDML